MQTRALHHTIFFSKKPKQPFHVPKHLSEQNCVLMYRYRSYTDILFTLVNKKIYNFLK